MSREMGAYANLLNADRQAFIKAMLTKRGESGSTLTVICGQATPSCSAFFQQGRCPMTEAGWTVCIECGMMCEAVEYHPYAACLMFKQCLNSETVRANLQAVRDDSYHQGRVAGLTFAAEQAGKGAELWDAGMKPREAEALREFQRWLQGKAQQAQDEKGAGDA